MDVVFDTLGGAALDNSWQTLKKGGRLVSICAEPDQAIAAQNAVTASFYFVQPNSQQLTEIAELADAGKLIVNIDSEFSLEQIPQAHDRSETGRAVGKIIINIIA